MGIEFSRQPPKEQGDTKSNFPFEQTLSDYDQDGLDLVSGVDRYVDRLKQAD